MEVTMMEVDDEVITSTNVLKPKQLLRRVSRTSLYDNKRK
jgi:hypothetical protein